MANAMLRMVLVVTVAAAAGGLVATERAEAWSKDYCAVFVPTDGHYCHHGNYNSLTYNSGRRQAGVGVCVYAITEAGNVRGGNRTICSGSVSGFASICFTYELPMSQGRTYPQFNGMTLYGHVDNSPNHTGCF